MIAPIAREISCPGTDTNNRLLSLSLSCTPITTHVYASANKLEPSNLNLPVNRTQAAVVMSQYAKPEDGQIKVSKILVHPIKVRISTWLRTGICTCTMLSSRSVLGNKLSFDHVDEIPGNFWLVSMATSMAIKVAIHCRIFFTFCSSP